MTIEVEKNYPVPFGATKYPWESMEVGDSFTVPSGATKNPYATAKYGCFRYHPRKFICRRDPGTKMHRIWRTE